MTNMNDLINAANIAATKSDRWAFFLALFILGIFAIAVMRYFVVQGKEMAAAHKESRDAHLAALKENQEAMKVMVAEQGKTQISLAVCLDRNTQSFDRNTEAFDRSTEALNDCTKELERAREERK